MTTRALSPAPDAALDPITSRPRFGSYRGELPRVDLSAVSGGALRRIARHKRWMYVAIATDDLWLAVAAVRLGYAANAFAYAFDKRRGTMLATASAIAPPFACDVRDRAGEGCAARYAFAGTRVSITRPVGSPSYLVEATFRGLSARAIVDTEGAPPALTAIAAIPGGVVNTTEKRALLPASGHVEVNGRRHAIEGGLAGFDYTNGLLARHTAWRWAFALGTANGPTNGAPRRRARVGLNLVQGFVGEPECAVWIDGQVYPLAEGRFDFDPARPLDPWRVTTADGAVDLRFTPGGMHAETKSLGLVASRFVQPAGTYTGTIRVDGVGAFELDEVLGVTEDQDVLW